MSELEPSVLARRPEGLSRRDLMRAIGLSAGGIALGVVSLGGASTVLAGTVSSFVVGLSLEVDGAATPLYSAEGGNAYADVIPEALVAGEAFLRKHSGAVKYEDVVLKVPLGSAKSLLGWINGSLNKGPMPKSGAIVTTSATGVEARRLEFVNAVITEVMLAPLDTADLSDSVPLTLRLSPQMTRLVGPGTAPLPLPPVTKHTLARSFRFSIQGLEKATDHTAKIAALTMKRPQAAAPIGLPREPSAQFGPFDCSLVSATLTEADAGVLYSWFDDAILKGNGAKTRRAGRIDLLTPDLKSVLATVDLVDLDIVRYAPLPVTTGDRGPAMVQVDMYCDTFSVTV